MLRALPLLLLSLALSAGPALAAHGAGPGPVRFEAAAGAPPFSRQKGGEITLEQAVEQVRAETGGRILSAETVQANGRRVHRIKVLTPDRRVRVVNVEAGNGRR